MKSRVLVLTLCLWGFGGLTLAQESVETAWTAEYEPVNLLYTVQAVDMALDDSGNVVVLAAQRNVEWKADVLLLKYDSDGNLVWTATYDTPGHGDDDPVGLALDSLGNAYVAATTESGDGMSNILVAKFDRHGQLLWAQQYDGAAHKRDDASAIAAYPGGGVVVTGSSMISGFYPDLVVLRFGAEGALLWSRSVDYPGHQTEAGRDVVIGPGGDVFVVGTGWAGSHGNDIVMAKFSPDGTEIWRTAYDSPEHADDVATAAAASQTGSFLVTGVIGGSGDASDIVTISVSAAGAVKWVARYHSAGNRQDQPADVAVDSTGNVFVAGTAGAALYDVNGNFVTLKYDTAGALSWSQVQDFYGDWDRASSLALDSLDCVYVTGSATGQDGKTMYGTVKYVPNGRLIWQTVFRADGDASPVKVAVWGRCVLVTGTVAESKVKTKIVTVKYRQTGPTVPVELVGLNARSTADGVVLTWQTKSESDNYGFQIQRQERGEENWATVGFVRGHGTTERSHQYSFVDRSLAQPGLYFYRLRQIDSDGSSTISEPVSVFVAVPRTERLLAVTPNPFNSSAVLRFRVPADGHVELAIFDAQGRRVSLLVNEACSAGRYRLIWNAEGFPSGVYFARLRASGKTQVAKLLLLR